MITDSFLESLIAQYGEEYRGLIETTVKDVFNRAASNPRINLATYNFARHVAAVVAMTPLGHPHARMQ